MYLDISHYYLPYRSSSPPTSLLPFLFSPFRRSSRIRLHLLPAYRCAFLIETERIPRKNITLSPSPYRRVQSPFFRKCVLRLETFQRTIVSINRFVYSILYICVYIYILLIFWTVSAPFSLSFFSPTIYILVLLPNNIRIHLLSLSLFLSISALLVLVD